MSKITDFPLKTVGEETPERILKAAMTTREGLSDVIVIGNVGGEIWVSGNSSDTPHILGLIELGKHKVLCDCSDND